TVTITNPTELDITNIVFNYNLTPFSAIDAKGCGLNENQMQWKGSLKPKYDKVCTATIYADREGKYSLSGNLEYFNGFETEKKAANATEVNVLPKQLKTTHFIDNETEVKKPFYYNISLQNLHQSEDIRYTGTIALPAHVSLIKDIPSFEKNAKILKHIMTLKPKESINYSLYLEKNSKGREPITLRLDYTIKGISDSIENSTYIDAIEALPITEAIQAAEPEPEKKQEKQNETSNLTAAQVQTAPQTADENKTTETKLKPENKTAEQVVVIDIQKPGFFNKNILLLIIAVIVSFLVVVLTVFKIRKGRKKDENIEKLKEELKL
ncbi:hypothetical protein HYY71_01010, partial [Candidatus Woesearchaeota archaeon]|nr:hypothetical protein [Candidatus Woesearchaeota archaeon]